MHSHKIFEAERLILFKYTKFLDYKTLIDSVREAVQDPKYMPGFDVITDLRDVEVKLSPEEARAAAAQVAADRAILGRSAILTNEPRSTAISTLYVAAIAGQHPLKIFSSIAGVAAFLGRDLSKILPE